MLYLVEVYALLAIVVCGLAFGAFLVLCALMTAATFITRLIKPKVRREAQSAGRPAIISREIAAL
jgi:hypothetical protein